MKTKVLVTGANGQLALTIKELFGVNNDSIQFDFATKKDLDITNTNKIEDFFNKKNYNYCINCAAYTNVEQSEISINEAFKINAEGVKNIAQECFKHSIILIHISTDYVYDGEKQHPYNEDDKPNPINIYGKSKLAGEEYIKQITPEFFIIRTSWLYSKYGKNFFKTVIDKVSNGFEMNVITTQKGTPTSCIDLSRFIYFIIKNKNKRFGVYHFSGLGETTWYGFASEIALYFKNATIIPTDNFQTKTSRPKYSVLNNSKVEKIGAHVPFWKDSVKKMIEVYCR